VVKLQAEITRVDNQLIDIQERRAALVARLGGLRDRPLAELPVVVGLPLLRSIELDRREMESRTFGLRPELAAAAARIARAEALEQLAEKRFRPDFTVGLTYTAVEPRRDQPGRLQPPPGNGDDIFGLQGGLTLPVRRGKLRAGLEEAHELKRGAHEIQRAVRSRIAAELEELTDRIPLGWQQLRLLQDVLILQAEEALDSARAGYVAGTLNALDLLDAEHVLFGARTAVARAAADYAIYLARLEGVVGEPLEVPAS
jgi:outer membrane protein TolC